MSSPERDVLVADVLRVSPELAVRVAEAIDAAARFGEATLDALRSEVERLSGVYEVVLTHKNALLSDVAWLRAALARVADCSSYALLCTACKNAVAAALLGDEEEGTDG